MTIREINRIQQTDVLESDIQRKIKQPARFSPDLGATAKQLVGPEELVMFYANKPHVACVTGAAYAMVAATAAVAAATVGAVATVAAANKGRPDRGTSAISTREAKDANDLAGVNVLELIAVRRERV